MALHTTYKVSSPRALLFPLQPSFRTTLVSNYSPWHFIHSENHDAIKERVENVWNEALQNSPKTLFNGLIANLVSYSPESLEVAFIEYKLFYGWQHDAFLHHHLSIHPLGVSGMTCYRGSVILGKRSSKMAVRGNLYELAPSGSIDPRAVHESHGHLDLSQMILHELFEEASIPSSAVRAIVPRALGWTLTDGIWDVTFEIMLDDEKEIHLPHSNEEYQALSMTPIKEAKESVRNRGDTFVPLSALMIHQF